MIYFWLIYWIFTARYNTEDEEFWFNVDKSSPRVSSFIIDWNERDDRRVVIIVEEKVLLSVELKNLIQVAVIDVATNIRSSLFERLNNSRNKTMKLKIRSIWRLFNWISSHFVLIKISNWLVNNWPMTNFHSLLYSLPISQITLFNFEFLCLLDKQISSTSW
jgi:hypothetical protein